MRQAERQAQQGADPAAERQAGEGAAEAFAHGRRQAAVEHAVPGSQQYARWRHQDVFVQPAPLAGQLPERQQDERQQPGLQALPAVAARTAAEFGGRRVRPVHQAVLGEVDAAIHQHTGDADDQDADEHDVEHEQLATPDHQVAEAFAGGQQLDGEQRRPAGGQGDAQAGHE
ncbi:hypothetical protein D3C80_1402140 [compost metagenome]